MTETIAAIRGTGHVFQHTTNPKVPDEKGTLMRMRTLEVRLRIAVIATALVASVGTTSDLASVASAATHPSAQPPTVRAAIAKAEAAHPNGISGFDTIYSQVIWDGPEIAHCFVKEQIALHGSPVHDWIRWTANEDGYNYCTIGIVRNGNWIELAPIDSPEHSDWDYDGPGYTAYVIIDGRYRGKSN
jgi:hypothetical protein